MKKALLAILFGSALVLGACGGNSDNATKDNTSTTDNTAKNETKTDNSTSTASVDPEKVTQTSCISCHGEGLKGSVGPDLTKVGATLSKDEIKDVLKNGRNAMPAQATTGLSDEEVDAVAQWLSEKK